MTTTNTDLLTVEYRCRCTGAWTPVRVRYRGRHEELEPWFEEMRAEVAKAHALASVLCASQTFDLRIPHSGGDGQSVGRRVLS